MTTRRTTVTDALIARALAERASGPDVDLVPMIMAATLVTPQRRGRVLGFGPRRRSSMLVLAAAALAASLIAVGIVGSNVIRPRLVERPLPGNGPITAGESRQVVEFDALTGAEHPGALASMVRSNMILRLDWSRDGAHLAISTDQDVSIYDAATGQTRSLRPCGFCAATWLPDGTALSIIDGGDARSGVITGSSDVISLIDPTDGRALSTIKPDPVYVDHIGGLSWSPDGRRLAISGSNADDSTASLAVMDRDGSNVRPISLPTPGWPIVDASWSPDGSTIAYIGFGVPGQDLRMSMHLALVDPDGARPRRTFDIGDCACLGFSPDLTWSPDGRTIAFTSLVENAAHLFLANADGSDIHMSQAGAFGPLAWRPIPSSDPN